MYATQSSRLGVPRHATVRPLSRIRFLPSIFASGFRLASMRSSPLRQGALWCAPQPYEPVLAVSRLRLAATEASFDVPARVSLRESCARWEGSRRWTIRASLFRGHLLGA